MQNTVLVQFFFEALRIEWQESTPLFYSLPERRNEMKLKIFRGKLLYLSFFLIYSTFSLPILLCGSSVKVKKKKIGSLWHISFFISK